MAGGVGPRLRALLFAYYFPPMGGMGSLRALSFARHLPEAGIDVSVVAPRTGTWGHDESLSVPGAVRVLRTGTLEPGVVARSLSGGAPGGVMREMGGGGRAKAWLQRLIHVPDANVGWVPAAIRAGLREARERRPDVILSSSPPLSAHLAASAVASRLRIPFVADVRDYFRAQRLFGGWRAGIDRRIENRVLGRVAGLTAPYAGILDDLRSIHRPVPSTVIRNGYDEEDFESPAPEVRSGAPELVHVGTTYPEGQSWEGLLAAVAETTEEAPALRLRFVGREDPDMVDRVRKHGLAHRAEFTGYLSHEEAVTEMRAAPALLLFQWARDPRLAKGLVLGKMFEVLRAGRPVLAVTHPEGEAADLLRELGGAFICPPGNSGGLRRAVLTLARGEGPDPVPPDRLLPYTRRAQALRLGEWLGELLARPSRGGVRGFCSTVEF